LRALGWLLVAALLAVPVAARAQTEAVYQLGHFSFENDGEIPDMRVGYVTWGTLNPAKDNAILLLPGTSGNRHGYDAHIGPGKTFDTDKYFVIGADPIGGGTSYALILLRRTNQTSTVKLGAGHAYS
jgi:homoserine O-acetyltransferase